MTGGWTVIVPLKAEGARKSRLSPAMAPDRRAALAARLYAHVVGCIAKADLADRIIVVSPDPPPGDFDIVWRPDANEPVNAAFERMREPGRKMMVVNADLPLLGVDDLRALAAAAVAHGAAIAPDRHGSGTNALALMPGTPFRFAFGLHSLEAHRHAAPRSALVERTGLAYDIDRIEDIEAAAAISDEAAALLAV